ncbi:MAG: adenosylcobinamide-GDP ribazoletransferase [Bacteroidota bacterium]
MSTPTTDQQPSWARQQLRAFLTGVMFLTRLPCPAWVGHDAEYLARSTPYFPVIGLAVGLFGAAVYLAVALLWPPLIALVAAIAATVWLTGAFHEDGLADTFDGLGGGWTVDEMVTIMKDSRVGTYGAVALVLTLAVKLGALAVVVPKGGAAVAGALVAGHVLGRWSSLPLIWRLPYVQHSGAKSKPFAASVTAGRLVVGTLAALLFVGVALHWQAVPAFGTAAGVTVVGGRYLRRTLGGITGDALGAVNSLTEAAVYLALAAGSGSLALAEVLP